MRHTTGSKATRASHLPYDPEREFAVAGRRTKQLIILATDVLVAKMAIHDRDPAALADQLVEHGILPGCYRSSYDERFLSAFGYVLELTRNLLVSDSPFVPNTAGELAAQAIFRQARMILAARGAGWEGHAADLDPRLPEQLSLNAMHLEDELEELQDATLEDHDVLALFNLPADDDPPLHLSAKLRPDERLLLRFENWLAPFGNVPRPHVTYDGRAWPVAS